jgi:hypothetical protein
MTQIKIQVFCHGDPEGFCGRSKKGTDLTEGPVAEAAPKLRLRGLVLVDPAEEWR